VPIVAVRARAGLVPDGGRFALPSGRAVDQDDEWLLDRQLATWQEKYPDVSVRRLTTPGRAARSLLDRTVGAGLLVLGSRRWRGVPGAMIGSTRHAVLHRSACPVAIVGAGAGR
jgi:nucleotide-binding universal stress UspA family protein